VRWPVAAYLLNLPCSSARPFYAFYQLEARLQAPDSGSAVADGITCRWNISTRPGQGPTRRKRKKGNYIYGQAGLFDNIRLLSAELRGLAPLRRGKKTSGSSTRSCSAQTAFDTNSPPLADRYAWQETSEAVKSFLIIRVAGRLNAITALATGAEARPPMLTVERVKGIEPSS
jgi:hypothetical protein